jgi:anti-sigma factor RsiW
MKCQDCQALIDDFVDSTLDAAHADRVEAHLAGCDECRAMAEDFRNIRLTARGLEQLTPPPKLWTELSKAVETERERRWRNVVPGLAVWQVVVVAATLLLIVGGSSWVVWRQLAGARATPAVTTPIVSNTSPELAQSVESELKLAEEHYERAIAGLEQITKVGSGALDPHVSAVLQKNLSVIDQAIGESRAALRTQPTSDVAQQSLFQALRSKVTLLQETVSLINEMRKGDQEGAARIVSGLNQ